MVNSKYALRESTSKANSLKNRESSSSSSSTSPPSYKATSSLYLSDFYTEKDPQYHHYEAYRKMTKSSKKSKSKSKPTLISSGGGPVSKPGPGPGTKPGHVTASSRKGKGKGKGRKQNKKSKTAPSPATLPLPYEATSSINRIRNPGVNDVLCGRGGNINNHAGNKLFRSYVSDQKNAYNLTTNKHHKAIISQSIVDRIHNLIPSGRFLIKDNSTYGGTFWMEVDSNKAMAKTSQALREGAPTIRAMAAVKGVARKTAKSIGALGKRKRASYKRTASKVEKDTEVDSQSSKDSLVEEEMSMSSHPLIVPMTNGHRGKQLIPRQTAQEAEETETQIETETETLKSPSAQEESKLPSIPNPCVSFDEDLDPGLPSIDNRNKKLRKVIADEQVDAAILPSSEMYTETVATTTTPTAVQPPSSLSELPDDVNSSSGFNLPPLPPLQNVPISSSSCSSSSPYNNTLLPSLPSLAQRPLSSFCRMHSLVSSELSNFNDSFQGDETFINPFLNESRVIAGIYEKRNSGEDHTIATTVSSAVVGGVVGTTSSSDGGGTRSGESSEVSVASGKSSHENVDPKFARNDSNGHCSLWSVDSDSIGSNFYGGVITIHDITHPDITTPLNGQDDTIPTHLIPYERKTLVSPSSKWRNLSSSSSSSFSTDKFDFANSQ